MTVKEIFSQNLRYYRTKAMLSQSKLADMVELTDKYLSDIERGLYFPSLQTIDSLAKALEIDTYLLLKYDETHREGLN